MEVTAFFLGCEDIGKYCICVFSQDDLEAFVIIFTFYEKACFLSSFLSAILTINYTVPVRKCICFSLPLGSKGHAKKAKAKYNLCIKMKT